MWTAKITDVIKSENGKLDIRVELTDGVRIVKKEFPTNGNIDLNWLKSMVKSSVDTMMILEATAGQIVIGDFDFSMPAEDPAVTARRKWLDLYQKWKNVKEMVDVGILTGLEIQVVALKDKVKTDFKPAYLDYV